MKGEYGSEKISAEDGYFKKFREGFSTKYLSQVEELRKEGETDRERRKEA